jgi:hypothetical protein
MVADAPEDIAQPGLGLKAVEFTAPRPGSI